VISIHSGVDLEKILRVPKPIQSKWQGGAQMHYKPCIEIIGGARALLPMEVYAYEHTAKYSRLHEIYITVTVKIKYLSVSGSHVIHKVLVIHFTH
jgi:hypothetical protein